MTPAATGGTWDRTKRRLLFLAGNFDHFRVVKIEAPVQWMVTLWDLTNETHLERLDAELRGGETILLDSGIFSLCAQHARTHAMHIYDVLGMPPDEVDGFDDLLDRYIKVLKRFGDRVWGYVEMDLGGAPNKRRIRACLEAEGLTPMPVWHPLIDGLDYFDELAEGYDRFCMANLSTSDDPTRIRLLHHLTQRHCEYPDLWVHLLGMHPNEWFHALDVDSCDASTWGANYKWGRETHNAMLDLWLDQLPMDWKYPLQRSANSERAAELYCKSMRLAAAGMHHSEVMWQDWAGRVDELTGTTMHHRELVS